MSRTWSAAVVIALALFLTRWPLLSPFLTSFDSANFAFALDDFNPAEHKPQPPGYPLFVGLAKLIRILVADPAIAFFIAGSMAAVAAVLLTRQVAQEMFGRAAGWLAAALLLFHPSFWSTGLVDPVRVFLAAGSAGIGLLAWRAWNPGSHRMWFWAAAAITGVAAGFRPSLIFLCMPLLLLAGWRRKTTPIDWMLSSLALTVGVLSWLTVAAEESGGFAAYAALLRGYADEQFEPTSLFFGGTVGSAWKMAARCVAWVALPAAIWITAAPFLHRQMGRGGWNRGGLFLLTWLVPPLLFSALVHSAEPGHILSVAVPLCVAGGFVLGGIVESRASRTALPIGLAAVVAWNCWLFFRPQMGVQILPSIKGVRVPHERVARMLGLLDGLAKQGPVTMVASVSSAVPWRVVSYYYPKTQLIVLLSSPTPGSKARPAFFQLYGGRLERAGSDPLTLPGCGKLVWLGSLGWKGALHTEPPLEQEPQHGAIVAELRPGATIRLDPYTLTTSNTGCPIPISENGAPAEARAQLGPQAPVRRAVAPPS